MTDALPVLKGTLDVLALKALTWQPMHGFELTRWLEERSHHELQLEDAALYQALYRLEKRGLVEAEWGVTEQNRRARFYRITRSGQTHLKKETSAWLRYARTMTAILTETPEAAGG